MSSPSLHMVPPRGTAAAGHPPTAAGHAPTAAGQAPRLRWKTFMSNNPFLLIVAVQSTSD